MTKVTFSDVSKYLEQLRSIYLSIDESKFRKELLELTNAIKLVNSLDNLNGNEPLVCKETRKKVKKVTSFEHAIGLLLEKKSIEIKGTKMNYTKISTSEEVLEFLEGFQDSEIVKKTTALDLKLLYCLLTGEQTELKGKKEDLLKSIRRNIRARKRGEAFSKTI
ncbi:hypothetical protein ACOI1C_11990 [Bacillus sp. DJP31]|uniref:hypothetical protein n=1 Tax=Bacillus sp. DJP31 TaxID=3409789 RepID=UPI003BB58D3E